MRRWVFFELNNKLGNIDDQTTRTNFFELNEHKKDETPTTLGLLGIREYTVCFSLSDSSLHFAVSIGNLDRVRMLIQHDPSLKDQTDEKGWIPLHIACSRGQLECVKLLAAFSDHNLEQETPTGYTSMHLAAMNGHVNCMMVSLPQMIIEVCFICYGFSPWN